MSWIARRRAEKTATRKSGQKSDDTTFTTLRTKARGVESRPPSLRTVASRTASLPIVAWNWAQFHDGEVEKREPRHAGVVDEEAGGLQVGLGRLRLEERIDEDSCDREGEACRHDDDVVDQVGDDAPSEPGLAGESRARHLHVCKRILQGVERPSPGACVRGGGVDQALALFGGHALLLELLGTPGEVHERVALVEERPVRSLPDLTCAPTDVAQ